MKRPIPVDGNLPVVTFRIGGGKVPSERKKIGRGKGKGFGFRETDEKVTLKDITNERGSYEGVGYNDVRSHILNSLKHRIQLLMKLGLLDPIDVVKMPVDMGLVGMKDLVGNIF